MSMRYLLSLLALIACLPAAASDLKPADCAALADWATGFQSEPTEAVAPRVALPAAVSDEKIVPLFGKPVANWSRQDFGGFNKRLSGCQRALFKTDRDTANRLNTVRKAFKGIARSVRDLTKASEQAGQAVDQLLALPASAETPAVLELAAAALGGHDTAARARSLPRMAQRPMAQLTRATPNLATTTAGDLQGRLQGRIDELRAAEQAQAAAAAAAAQRERERLAAERAEAEARAAAALQTARRELDALPVAAESRTALDRLAALPALQTVPPDDAAAFRRTLAAKREAVDRIVQRERAAKMQEELRDRLARLRDFEIRQLADLGTYWQLRVEFARLARDPANAEALAAIGYDEAEQQGFGERFAAAAQALLPAFEGRLAAIPETEAGMQQARNSIVAFTGVRGRSTELQPYVTAAQQRIRAIDARLKYAAEWLPITPRLEALLQGDDVAELTIRGLAPGRPRADAVAFIRRQWGFEQVPDLSLTTTYGLSRVAQRQVAAERRDGGSVKLEDMDGRVGQITFTEHYKAKIELDVLRDWLTERLGQPDSVEPLQHGLSLTWRDGSRRLQVRAVNQVDVLRFNVGLRSQLGLALWNDDYEDYAEQASERCDKIRKMPRSEISIEQSMFFTTQCSLGMGPSVTPGL